MRRCSCAMPSDWQPVLLAGLFGNARIGLLLEQPREVGGIGREHVGRLLNLFGDLRQVLEIDVAHRLAHPIAGAAARDRPAHVRSEEHTSELQSLMRISYAVF